MEKPKNEMYGTGSGKYGGCFIIINFVN